jgi:uncharacterized small protein (DUF1192 family)
MSLQPWAKSRIAPPEARVKLAQYRQEAGMDEDTIGKPRGHEVGMVLDAMSVEELEERIAMLQDEIERLRTAIEARNKTRNAADALFKF